MTLTNLAQVIEYPAQPKLNIPEPFKGRPEKGQVYYMPDLSGFEETGVTENIWRGDFVDWDRLNMGLVHLTEANARAHYIAIIQSSGGVIQ